VTVPVAPETVLSPRLGARVRRFRGTLTVGLAADAFELSETAAFIYRNVDGRRSAGQIAALVADEYDIDADVALTDTLDALADLCDLDLLVPGEPGRAE
jgi:Coenzyme PQQ synthesis protein D (PqqD)